MKEVYDFLKKCGVFYIATVDGDQPRVRPFGTAEIFDNHLYIQTGKKKDVFKQIEANNKVLYMKNAKATIYSFTEAPKVIEF